MLQITDCVQDKACGYQEQYLAVGEISAVLRPGMFISDLTTMKQGMSLTT